MVHLYKDLANLKINIMFVSNHPVNHHSQIHLSQITWQIYLLGFSLYLIVIGILQKVYFYVTIRANYSELQTAVHTLNIENYGWQNSNENIWNFENTYKEKNERTTLNRTKRLLKVTFSSFWLKIIKRIFKEKGVREKYKKVKTINSI